MSAPLLLTATQAAHLLGVRAYDVAVLIESGELPAGMIRGRWVLAPSQVRAYADRIAPPASVLAWG